MMIVYRSFHILFIWLDFDISLALVLQNQIQFIKDIWALVRANLVESKTFILRYTWAGEFDITE